MAPRRRCRRLSMRRGRGRSVRFPGGGRASTTLRAAERAAAVLEDYRRRQDTPTVRGPEHACRNFARCGYLETCARDPLADREVGLIASSSRASRPRAFARHRPAREFRRFQAAQVVSSRSTLEGADRATLRLAAGRRARLLEARTAGEPGRSRQPRAHDWRPCPTASR